jgi:hypothetical protein
MSHVHAALVIQRITLGVKIYRGSFRKRQPASPADPDGLRFSRPFRLHGISGLLLTNHQGRVIESKVTHT